MKIPEAKDGDALFNQFETRGSYFDPVFLQYENNYKWPAEKSKDINLVAIQKCGKVSFSAFSLSVVHELIHHKYSTRVIFIRTLIPYLISAHLKFLSVSRNEEESTNVMT